jgi:hypothetical protein
MSALCHKRTSLMEICKPINPSSDFKQNYRACSLSESSYLEQRLAATGGIQLGSMRVPAECLY